MAAKKKLKGRVARPATKKASAKKSAKGALKRTRKAAPVKASGKSESAAKAVAARPRVMIVPPAEPLFRAAELDGAARKPARKIEVARPARPPAKLPIPQATFFF